MFKVFQWLFILFWTKSKLFMICPWVTSSAKSFLTITKLFSSPPSFCPLLTLSSESSQVQPNSFFKTYFQLSLQEVSLEPSMINWGLLLAVSKLLSKPQHPHLEIGVIQYRYLLLKFVATKIMQNT